MKLKALLKINDSSPSRLSLPDNLGDAYLLKNNPPYRNIRLAALKAKFKFTANRFHDYDTLSLTQLPRILKTKTIPYYNNVRPIREIEKTEPGFFSLNDLPPLKSNHVFHEAAHAVAYSLLLKHLPKRRRNSELSYVLHAFIQEAFANACESFANSYADQEVHDELLFKNCYIMEEQPVRVILRSAIKSLGEPAVFKLLFFSFLHANYLRTKEPRILLKRVIPLVFERAPSSLAHVLQVFKTGFELDPEFTLFTNAFCLRLGGAKNLKASLLDADFLAVFEANSIYRALIDEMAKIVTA